MTDNPFLESWTTPFGMPPFDRIRPEHFPPAFNRGMEEQIAHAAAQGLTDGTLRTLLDRQTAALGDQQPCPDCGRACPVGRQERPLRTKGVELRQNEPVCHCPDCRRDFFPPAADPAT